jgi:tRNA pseudouridine55 synthase
MTDTYDISGRAEGCTPAEMREKECAPAPFSFTTLSNVAQSFVGDIQQAPPRYSALKRKGRKLYELSRRGVHVQPEKRSVFVRSFSIIDYRHPVVSFETVVGKGVYVRSLAHDFGQRLKGGATLLSLRRTKIGDYLVDDAADLGAVLHERAR